MAGDLLTRARSLLQEGIQPSSKRGPSWQGRDTRPAATISEGL